MFLRRGCARYREDLSLLQDGCLCESRIRRLEEHLRMCESCRVQRDLNRMLASEVASATEVEPSPDFDSKVVVALRMQAFRRPTRVHWKQFSLASAAAAVLMTAALQYASLGETPDRPTAPPGSSATVRPEDLLERYKMDRTSPLWYHRELPVEREDRRPDEPERASG